MDSLDYVKRILGKTIMIIPHQEIWVKWLYKRMAALEELVLIELLLDTRLLYHFIPFSLCRWEVFTSAY